MKFTRKNEKGTKIPDTYYTLDYKYMIERGSAGWNVYRIDGGRYDYSFSADTLKAAKEELLYEH